MALYGYLNIVAAAHPAASVIVINAQLGIARQKRRPGVGRRSGCGVLGGAGGGGGEAGWRYRLAGNGVIGINGVMTDIV